MAAVMAQPENNARDAAKSTRMTRSGSRALGACQLLLVDATLESHWLARERGMTNVSRFATTLACMVAAIVCFSGTAKATVPVGQQVIFVNVKTGKCLTIAGGVSPANSLPTVQYNCDEDLSRR